MKIVMQNRQNRPLPGNLLREMSQAARLSLLVLGRRDRGEVSLTLVTDAAIRRLNRRYRGLDRPTDVLSFAMAEGPALACPPGEDRPLGDIVISVDRAAAQAASYGHSLRRELLFLLVHGMLHLLGLDHQEPAERRFMEEKQRQVMALLGAARDRETEEDRQRQAAGQPDRARPVPVMAKIRKRQG